MTTIIKIITIMAILSGTANAQMFWNQAAKFENGNYISGPSTLANNIVGSVTVEAWVYPLTNTGTRYIVFKGNAGNGYYLRLNSTGTVSFGTNGVNRVTSTSVVDPGKWTHIGGSYNVTNDEFKIYINGHDEVTVVSDNPPNNNTDSLFIGKFGAGNFTGLMDEVRIWTKAVPQDDMRRNRRTSLTISNGPYTSLLFSMPFQRINNTGTVFTTQDLSLNLISVNPTVNHGVIAVDLSNRPSTYLSGNEALKLLGDYTSYAACTSTVLNDINGAMTVEAWINIEGVPAVNQYIFYKNAVGGNGYRFMVNNLNKLSFSINNSAFYNGSATLAENKWYHVAWVVSAGGASSLYINGVLDAFYGSTGTPASNTDSLYIGRGFLGKIDEVRMYKYERPVQDIRDFMFESIDESNKPAGESFSFNLDGSTWSNSNFQVMFLRGGTYFTSPTTINETASPLIRADNLNFHNGYYKKLSQRRIPETGSSGLMVDDSITVPDNVSINDINMYLSFNHSASEQLQVTLISPSGQSMQLMNGYQGISAGYNFTTIFDDQADSSLVDNTYISVSPRIRPQTSLNSVFTGLNSAGVWKLRINDVSGLNTGELLAWGLQINNSSVIGIENISQEVPNSFKISQNYPNPFNPTTNIEFNIAKKGFTKLIVYDILGRETATLVSETLNPGTYKVDFNGSNLASGVYFYKLETAGFTDIKKMLLVK